MDLCLRGSQINLVSRQKPKAKVKYSSHTNLHQTLTYSRPRSATLFQKRARSSPFLYRPQSADPKFGRNLNNSYGQYCNEYDLSGVKYNKNSKRFQSLSSSSLLKLLLDEPIKRSWLCRDTISPDTQSDLSSCRKGNSYNILHKRTRTESVGSSSVEGENSARLLRPMSNKLKDQSSSRSYANDYWYTIGTSATNSTLSAQAALLSKGSKPDLPGRVSFCKVGSTQTVDVDSSDCDNDKQEEQYTSTLAAKENKSVDYSISAPGPLNLSPYKHIANTDASTKVTAESSSSSLKKSVHFGTAGAEDVFAETYEYPKCPSENCSCSTRSSSTASLHDALDTKCACAAPTCKYALEVPNKHRTNLDDLDLPMPSLEPKGEAHFQKTQNPIEESVVIREYKNVVGEQLENSVVKNLLDDGLSKLGAYSTLNTEELPAYLEKYSAPINTELQLEKQNNLSETKSTANFKSTTKRNLLSSSNNELLNTDYNFGQNLPEQQSYASSSEAVINNYLKVATSPPRACKKKDNNKPNSADTIGNKKLKSTMNTSNGNTSNSRGKTATTSKLKKATSFGNLREDSNLNEFHLDKVDSWMSMHQGAMADDKPLKQQSTMEDDYQQLRKESLELCLNSEDTEQGESSSQASIKSDENSQEDSTYDEIVSVIKEIEEDKKQDNFAERSTNDIELKLHTPESVKIPEKTVETTSTGTSPDKYKDILNYLDDVEDNCDKTLLETRRSLPDTNRSEVEFIVEPDIAEDVPKLSDLLMIPNHQLARRVIALSLRANELSNAVHLSKEHLMKIRAEKQQSIRTEKANSTTRMRDQKKHYETIVKRHQNFIEQLLKDKGTLCEKVAALTRRLESQNQAWQHKLETEVTRAKETTMAGEKIRRERWVRENTKKIKELTVRGIEAEINKMNCNHQREITELKRAHQQQLLDALEEARIKHEQIENSIRESCAQDRETIIEKERKAIRERFERQLEQERTSFEEQRQRLHEDFAEEKAKMQNDLKHKDIDYQKRREELENEKKCELEQAISELQGKMSKQEEKYQNRINTIEKQYEADFEIWKREYENSCKLAQVEKENTIRQHYRAERDRQIDAIVSRMDAEALKNTEEFEGKVIRLKEKYEKDLQDAENLEKSLREKYTETRGKLAESDAQVRNCQAELKQLQIELVHSKKMCADFVTERDQLREHLRSEIQAEVGSFKMERDNEIQQIHKRVQQAIEKKDATIDILQKENGSLRERCLKLEAVIRQQRKDYCVK